MKIAYLINQYPRISHTFVRREIAALEAQDISIKRFSIRPCPETLVDEADKLELKRTRVVLDVGYIGLISSMTSYALTRPLCFWETLKLTLRISWKSDRGLLRHLAYLSEAAVLQRWLKEEKVDHLHAHFGTNSTAVAMLCHSLGGPEYSFTTHGPSELDRAPYLYLDEKIERASFVVAISHFVRSQLFRWSSNEFWSKIHIIHCGVDEQFLQVPSTPPNSSDFVCVGRLSEIKGQLLLVKAAKQLREKKMSFTITLVGDGHLRPEIESLISRYELQDIIKMTGSLSSTQIRETILASRVFVLPTFGEGLPVVIMEALALGRPVISTYIAGIPELVENGECGWLIPAGSLDKLVSAMTTALETPVDELQRMGQIGAKRVTEDHDVNREAKKLANLFRNSIKNKPES